jgi:uncharacterized protein YndB with AHSA1/START domain
VRVEGLVIEVKVWLAAPAERVFDALTQPEWLAAWWGDDEAYTTHDWQMAPVEGSTWRCRIVSRRGEQHALGGKVLTVRRPHELRLSWQPGWQPALATEVHFELQPQGEGTLLTLSHSGFRPDFTGLTTHAAGWPWVLGWLAQAMSSMQRRER